MSIRVANPRRSRTIIRRLCLALLPFALGCQPVSASGTPATPPSLAQPSATGTLTLPVILQTATPQAFRILAFTRTLGFRHESIPDGLALVSDLGSANGFSVTATEDPAVFSDAGLAPYQVVVFLLTTGDVLDEDQQGALQRFVTTGGGYVGVHSATDTEADWPWYAELVGARFAGHPPGTAQATLHVEDRTHQSTQHLEAEWPRTDEWYNFDRNPRPDVTVLLTIDEASYTGGTMGADHPMSWYQAIGAGRSWYTALGHTRESYADPDFRAHVLGGILWAAEGP